jgi:hypothetical protein
MEIFPVSDVSNRFFTQGFSSSSLAPAIECLSGVSLIPRSNTMKKLKLAKETLLTEVSGAGLQLSNTIQFNCNNTPLCTRVCSVLAICHPPSGQVICQGSRIVC